MSKRIWELDAFRGIMMILIMAYHLFYDLVFLFDLVDLDTPFLLGLYRFCNNWLGSPFLLLSGLCVTLGSRPVRRGLQVMAGGLLINLVTLGMYLFGFADKGIIIYFGVLHCIATCMLLWPLFRKLPTWLLTVLGILLATAGLYMRGRACVDFPWLTPIGIVQYGFASSDFFPLLPNLGYFLLGAAGGRTLYKEKRTLFPRVNEEHFLVRFFSFFGKHSLIFYLLHQPVFAGLVSLWVMLT